MTTRKQQMLLLAGCLVIATGCATVDATVDKMTSSVSDRFNKNDKGDPENVVVPPDEPVAAPEVSVPTQKPLLVEVQEKLRTMGYYRGPISGQLDSRTEAAIQDFQLDKDLRINGRPSKSLLKKIDEELNLAQE